MLRIVISLFGRTKVTRVILMRWRLREPAGAAGRVAYQWKWAEGGVSMMHDVAVPIDDECEAIRLSRNVVGRLDMILEDDADLVATVVFMPKSVGMDWRQWRHCEFRVRSLTNHLQDKPRFSKIPTNRISSTTQARTFTRSYLTSLRPQNTWAYLGIPLEACIYPLPQAIIGHSYSSNADVVAVSSTSN